MPLTTVSKPKELWSKVVGKDGTVYKNIEKCNDINAWSSDNSALSDKIEKGMEEWLASDPANEAKITQFSKDGGYQYKDTDGITYKILKNKDETLNLSRILPGGGSGGFKKGGSYTHLRTDEFKVGQIELVAMTIQNQGPNDNWKVTKIAGNTPKEFYFTMENLKQYTPTAVTTTEPKKQDASKEEESEQED